MNKFCLAAALGGALFALLFALSPTSASHRAQAAVIGSAPGPVAIGGVLRDSPAWEAYRRRFVSDSGRIVDTANAAVSHSEGQGYGMLLAVAAGDRPTFDKILTWTTLNLHIRNDNLMAWRWTPSTGAKADRHNATDADILIAWALAEAADYWNDSGYLDAARAITRDIVSRTVSQTQEFGPVLLAGAESFAARERPDGPVVNLSYWVLPAFYRLAQVEPNFDWNALIQSGLSLLREARFGARGLPTDWLSLGKERPAPAQGFENRFGYDALRIPLYLFWGGAASAELLKPFDQIWTRGAAIVDFGSASAPVTPLTEPGYQALAALARCVTTGARYPSDFYRFNDRQNYYPATLKLLSLIAAATRGGPCLDRVEMTRIVSPQWVPKMGSLARFAPEVEPPTVEIKSAGRNITKLEGAAIGQSAWGTQNMPDQSDLFSHLQIFALACAVFGGFYWLVHKSGRETPETVPDNEDSIKSAVSAIQPASSNRNPIVPRTLPKSPFTPSMNPKTLAAEIEIAAEACVRLSRSIGLIYFEVPSFHSFEREHGTAAAEELINRSRRISAARCARRIMSPSSTAISSSSAFVCSRAARIWKPSPGVLARPRAGAGSFRRMRRRFPPVSQCIPSTATAASI